MDDFIFPLRQRPILDYKSEGRQFGANRSGGRKHAACDLIVPQGTEILAMADGKVLLGPYDFYSGTSALEVKHINGKVMRYGEISKIPPAAIKVGAAVSQGQAIARVGRLDSGSSMLHLEMYAGTENGPLTQAGHNQFKRRSDLIDPTPFLDAAKLLSDQVEVETGGLEGRITADPILSLRSEPTTAAPKLLELKLGTVVKVLAEVTGDAYKWDRRDWLKIESNGKTGFVAGFYVKLDQVSPTTTTNSNGGEQLTHRWVKALLEADTKGASEETARQDGISPAGVPASEKLAERDLQRVLKIASRFVNAAAKFGVPAAMLAALASRESRSGGFLNLHGWGDNGNAFGIMQVDKRFHQIVGESDPASLEHIEQATGIFVDGLEKVIDQHKDWLDKHLLQGAAVTYNAGAKNVQTPEHMDVGTTGNDYGSDVIARSKFFYNHPELELFRA